MGPSRRRTPTPLTSPQGRGKEPDRTAWPVYLPDGAWVDAWTGASLSGPVELERGTPLDEIPVYVRASAWGGLEPVFRDASG